MLHYLILGMLQGNSRAPIDRCEQFLKNANSLSVIIRTTYNGTPVGSGLLQIQRPNRLSFSLDKGFYYRVSELGAIDVDKNNRTYDEFPPLGRIVVHPSRLSNAMQLGCPQVLVTRNLQGMFPKNQPVKVTSGLKVGSIPVDLVECHIQSQMGAVDEWLWVESGGKPIKLRVKSMTQSGPVDLTYDFSNYIVNRPIPAASFSTVLPIGYSPYSLESSQGTVPAGESLPNVRLHSPSGSVRNIPVDLAGENAVLAFVDSDFPRNAAYKSAVRELAAKVPNSRLVWIGTAGPESVKGLGADALFDPAPRHLSAWDMPGAPLVYILNAKGKVVQAYFGFNGTWENLDEVLKRLKSGA
jgi:hypothetical protein